MLRMGSRPNQRQRRAAIRALALRDDETVDTAVAHEDGDVVVAQVGAAATGDDGGAADVDEVILSRRDRLVLAAEGFMPERRATSAVVLPIPTPRQVPRNSSTAVGCIFPPQPVIASTISAATGACSSSASLRASMVPSSEPASCSKHCSAVPARKRDVPMCEDVPSPVGERDGGDRLRSLAPA
jgi:hypothetical protein